MPSPLIVTPRMRVRLLRPDDRREFVRVSELTRPLAERWSPLMGPNDTFEQLFETQLERASKGLSDGTEYRFVGELPDGRIAGHFNLFHIVRGVFLSAVASWGVNAEVSGQGYCTEGVAALLDFAFAPEPFG